MILSVCDDCVPAPRPRAGRYVWPWWRVHDCGSSHAVSAFGAVLRSRCGSSGCAECGRAILRRTVRPLAWFRSRSSGALLTWTPTAPARTADEVDSLVERTRRTLRLLIRCGWVHGGAYVHEVVPSGVGGHSDMPCVCVEGVPPAYGHVLQQSCAVCGGVGRLPLAHVHAHACVLVQGEVQYASTWDREEPYAVWLEAAGRRRLPLSEPVLVSRASFPGAQSDGVVWVAPLRTVAADVVSRVLESGGARWWAGRPVGWLVWCYALGWGRSRVDLTDAASAAARYVAKGPGKYVAKSSTLPLYAAAYLRVGRGRVVRAVARVGCLRGMDASQVRPEFCALAWRSASAQPSDATVALSREVARWRLVQAASSVPVYRVSPRAANLPPATPSVLNIPRHKGVQGRAPASAPQGGGGASGPDGLSPHPGSPSAVSLSASSPTARRDGALRATARDARDSVGVSLGSDYPRPSHLKVPPPLARGARVGGAVTRVEWWSPSVLRDGDRGYAFLGGTVVQVVTRERPYDPREHYAAAVLRVARRLLACVRAWRSWGSGARGDRAVDRAWSAACRLQRDALESHVYVEVAWLWYLDGYDPASRAARDWLRDESRRRIFVDAASALH